MMLPIRVRHPEPGPMEMKIADLWVADVLSGLAGSPRPRAPTAQRNVGCEPIAHRSSRTTEDHRGRCLRLRGTRTRRCRSPSPNRRRNRARPERRRSSAAGFFPAPLGARMRGRTHWRPANPGSDCRQRQVLVTDRSARTTIPPRCLQRTEADDLSVAFASRCRYSVALRSSSRARASASTTCGEGRVSRPRSRRR